MFVARLSLTDFRNHSATEIGAQSGLVVLAGPNGAGKTNILEALSLLAPGRGLRGSALPEMVRGGAEGGFAIAADCRAEESALAPVHIGTGTRGSAPGRRRVRINGAEAAATSLGEWLSFIWLTPAMDRLFVEGAGQRRRFLDRMALALEPAHAGHASRYEAAMRARTRLLGEDGPWDTHWLAALEAQMAEHGEALDRVRHALVDMLQTRLADASESPFARPAIALVDSDGIGAMPWCAPQLAEALARSRHSDARAGRALMGPHRVDLAVVHAAKNQPAARCSTGEQKALLLSIVLAHGDLVAAARGQRPILLLDELAAHLDPLRRAALFERLGDGGGQIWMTGTEMALFDAVPSSATRLHIEQGSLVQK
jgi:DNA replication and repair protein RecF